ncbi:hypothetical protein FA95DRAFT_442973 [Auriscalpium vulgare]|uniref:Uncharacterized protein n=1 Tax=Auriscalpium vulgare TaxID=40419 RepID=A0ACB8RHB7_9AGAM|nr:hypothetical protein FA95DRAFT_442973 [Auriscalpium vulgare]
MRLNCAKAMSVKQAGRMTIDSADGLEGTQRRSRSFFQRHIRHVPSLARTALHFWQNWCRLCDGSSWRLRSGRTAPRPLVAPRRLTLISPIHCACFIVHTTRARSSAAFHALCCAALAITWPRVPNL